MIVLDGNNRYHVIRNDKIVYTGNNVLKYLYWKFKGRKIRPNTTIKF